MQGRQREHEQDGQDDADAGKRQRQFNAGAQGAIAGVEEAVALREQQPACDDPEAGKGRCQPIGRARAGLAQRIKQFLHRGATIVIRRHDCRVAEHFEPARRSRRLDGQARRWFHAGFRRFHLRRPRLALGRPDIEACLRQGLLGRLRGEELDILDTGQARQGLAGWLGPSPPRPKASSIAERAASEASGFFFCVAISIPPCSQRARTATLRLIRQGKASVLRPKFNLYFTDRGWQGKQATLTMWNRR